MSNRQQKLQPIVTLEAMYLMSASASDLDFSTDSNVKIDPGVGPLPGLDFPAGLIVEPTSADGEWLDGEGTGVPVKDSTDEVLTAARD